MTATDTFIPTRARTRLATISRPSCSGMPRSIAGRDDPGILDHEDDASLRGAGAVNDRLGHDKPLEGFQCDGAVLEIDEEFALQAEKNSSSLSCLCQ